MLCKRTDMGILTLLSEPVLHQGLFCSDLGREKVPRVQPLIHEREEPLVRTQIFPFELVELSASREDFARSILSARCNYFFRCFLTDS
jgi:hypothetical protein